MAKITGYKSLPQILDLEVLPLLACDTWEEAVKMYDTVGLVQDVVRSFEYNGSTYYILRPKCTKEELKVLVAKHLKVTNTVAVKPVRSSDIPHGTQCDRCVAPALVKAEFSTGPLYACRHHANQFGWWLESMEKEA